MRIETALGRSAASIAQACVIGDGRPYLVALITRPPGRHRRGCRRASSASTPSCPETGRIRRYAVLEDTWAPGSDELTPTLKLRRHAVHARYADHIEALYAEG